MTAPTPVVRWMVVALLLWLCVVAATVITVVWFRRNKRPPRGFDVLPPKDDRL